MKIEDFRHTSQVLPIDEVYRFPQGCDEYS